MDDLFNSKLFTDNALFLIRQKNLRIGQVETDAGVSPGFFSKLTKEGSSKPSIEFAMRVAKILDTSLDLLISIDLTDMGPNESYILKFLSQLVKDTVAGDLPWRAQTKHQLENVRVKNGKPSHPLFSTSKRSEDENGIFYDLPLFNSASFGENTLIADTCYDVEMPSDARLFLMSVIGNSSANAVTRKSALEIWMEGTLFGPEYFCSSSSSPAIAKTLDKLYETVTWDNKRPKIDKRIKAITDAYLGIEGEEEELPFN